MADKTITFSFRVDKVLTDPTSVVLSDPTGTYGVKRNDTNETIVPANTAMERTSTGVYQYTFAEPAPGLTYTAYIETVYEGATYRFERFLKGSAERDDNLFLTLTDARRIVKDSVLRLPSNVVDDARLDDAIQGAGEEFCRRVKPIRHRAAVTTTPKEHEVRYPGNDYLHRRLLQARVIHDGLPLPQLRQVDDDTIARLIRDREAYGLPTQAAAFGSDTLILYPIPDAQYMIEGTWWEPFTRWTPGTEDAGDVVLNIPRDMVHGVLRFGVPAHYERGNEKQTFVRDAAAKFQQHIQVCLGQIDDVAPGGVAYVNTP